MSKILYIVYEILRTVAKAVVCSRNIAQTVQLCSCAFKLGVTRSKSSSYCNSDAHYTSHELLLYYLYIYLA